MTFSQASTNSAGNGADAIAFIEAGLSGHAGWSFVEGTTYTTAVGGVARTARVWKCLGAQNAGGADFRLILSRNTIDNGQLFIRLAEGYNATTHKAIRPAQALGGTPSDVSVIDWSIGNGTEYALSLSSGQGAQYDGAINSTNNITTDHFMVVSKSFVAYGVNQSGISVGGFYVGNFEPDYSDTLNPVIAVVCGVAGSATRFPNCAKTPTTGVAGVGDVYLLPGTFPGGYLTTLSSPEKFLARMEGANVMVCGYAAVAPPELLSQSGGGRRGTIPTSAMLMVSESIVPRNGEFFTADSEEYFRIGKNTAAAYSVLVGGLNQSFYIARDTVY